MPAILLEETQVNVGVGSEGGVRRNVECRATAEVHLLKDLSHLACY